MLNKKYLNRRLYYFYKELGKRKQMRLFLQLESKQTVEIEQKQQGIKL